MVALSVSISARISPSSTVSPTPLSHDATVPSSIVSLKRGILTTSTPSGMLAAGCSVDSSGWDSSASEVSSTAAVADSSLSKPLISSPSSPIMASKLSTAALSPSAIPMCNKKPSLKDSNSIVALSVSISARISPSSTLSPTFLSHEDTVPSSMVSLNRGMFTIIAIL